MSLNWFLLLEGTCLEVRNGRLQNGMLGLESRRIGEFGVLEERSTRLWMARKGSRCHYLTYDRQVHALYSTFYMHISIFTRLLVFSPLDTFVLF
jgi:hypothetical protein